MKSLTILVALGTFVTAPAFAQPPSKPSNAVIVGGRYVGQDPDAAIRSELRRDYQLHIGE